MKNIFPKVVAGLGIATGLSVAALPLATHAVDVITSVTIAANNNAGSCSTGTATTSTPAVCSGGGNNATGYTITIADKSGTNFSLSTAGAGAGGAVSSSNINPIASAAATVSGTNVYGVKFSATGGTGGGYAGTYTGTLVTAANVNSSGAGVNFVPVAASIGTILTASPGVVNITTTLGESHNLAIANGTYTNTLSIVYATK